MSLKVGIYYPVDHMAINRTLYLRWSSFS